MFLALMPYKSSRASPGPLRGIRGTANIRTVIPVSSATAEQTVSPTPPEITKTNVLQIDVSEEGFYFIRKLKKKKKEPPHSTLIETKAVKGKYSKQLTKGFRLLFANQKRARVTPSCISSHGHNDTSRHLATTHVNRRLKRFSTRPTKKRRENSERGNVAWRVSRRNVNSSHLPSM